MKNKVEQSQALQALSDLIQALSDLTPCKTTASARVFPECNRRSRLTKHHNGESIVVMTASLAMQFS